MKKALYIAFIVVFLGICSVPLLGLLFGYRNINVEKRALAPFPVFFDKKGFNEGFPEEVENYLSDHFAFKPQLVTADAVLREALFGESVSEKVIVGEDGWLFFAPTLPDYLATEVLSDNEILRLARVLSVQEEALARRGVAFVFVVAPNKASIVPERMPDSYTPTGADNNYDKLYRVLDAAGKADPDLRSILLNHSAEGTADGDLYLKLDSHWNNLGAWIAYRAIAESITAKKPEIVLPDFSEAGVEKREITNGDLSLMLYPASERTDTQYFFDLPGEYSSARPIRSMEDILIQTTRENAQGRMLMFRDSFANSLIPFFSDAFSSATYSRAVPYDYGLLTDDTDAVVLEIVERNLSNLLMTAPLLSSYPVESVPDVRPDGITLDCRLEQTEDELRVYGTATPSEYDPGEYYEVFIRVDGADGIDGSDGIETFVTFPILEKELLESTEDPDSLARRANVAFSARLDLSAYASGTYTLTIIVRGPTGAVSAPYGNVVVS